MRFPEPFYTDDLVTIFHGDCRDVLPEIDPDDVDLVLTDPPYGIAHKASDYWNGANVEGDDVRFDPTPLLRYGRVVLWGANHYCHSLPESNGWIVWDKRLEDSTGSGLKVPDAELAWTNVTRRIRVYRQLWAGPMRGQERFLHPTQKPVELMRWILRQWTEPGDLVLDPYMGSGPVAQACSDLGRRYIGVELVEDYCRVAIDRLAQTVLPLTVTQ